MAAEEARENERRVEELRQEQLASEMSAKHQSEMSELMSNADSDATRLKYASGTSELVGSEQRHELRTVETPVELPASPEYYIRTCSPDGAAVSELGSPDASELSAGTFKNGEGGKRESEISGPGSPRSLKSFGTNSGFGTSPTVGHAQMQRGSVVGGGQGQGSPTLGLEQIQRQSEGRNPRFREEGLGIVTSTVEWARGVDNEGRRIHRYSK